MNYTVLFFLEFICLTLITVYIFLLQKEIRQLNDKISQQNNQENKTTRSFRRNHSSINPVSFSNPIQARKNLYKDYENDKGLYEPITPRKGIQIKEDK